jgi:hypothetical protein
MTVTIHRYKPKYEERHDRRRLEVFRSDMSLRDLTRQNILRKKKKWFFIKEMGIYAIAASFII